MKKHKLLSCLLVVAMIFSLLPVSVFAADPVEAPVDTYGGLEDGTADPNWAGNQTPKVVSSEENLKAVLAQTLNPEASNYKNVLYLQIGSNFSIDSADYNALTLGGAGAEIWIDGNGKTITGEANYDFPLFFQKYASTVHIKDLTVTSHGKGVANPGVYNSVFWTQVNDASLDLRNVTIKDFGRYGIRIMAGTLTLTGGEIDCGQDSKNTTGIQAGGSADEGDTATVTVDGTTIKDSKYATWTEWCSAAIEALPGSNVNIKSATITGSNIGVLLDNATEVRGEHKADISVTIGQNGASNDTVTITAKEKADNDGAAVLFGSAGYGSTISGNVDLTINAGTFSLIDHDSDSASDSSALQVTFDGPNSTQGRLSENSPVASNVR